MQRWIQLITGARPAAVDNKEISEVVLIYLLKRYHIINMSKIEEEGVYCGLLN